MMDRWERRARDLMCEHCARGEVAVGKRHHVDSDVWTGESACGYELQAVAHIGTRTVRFFGIDVARELRAAYEAGRADEVAS